MGVMSKIRDEDQKLGEIIAENFLKGELELVLDYMGEMYNKDMTTIFVATLLDILNENFTNWTAEQQQEVAKSTEPTAPTTNQEVAKPNVEAPRIYTNVAAQNEQESSSDATQSERAERQIMDSSR